MVRGFDIFWATVAAILMVSPGHSARADSSTDICQARDEKADAAALDAYFVASLKEHGVDVITRPILVGQRLQARAFLERQITEKRAELCAAHLKLVEDIKVAVGKYTTTDCGAAAVVTLIERYMTSVASTFADNRQVLNTNLANHAQALKLKLFEVVRSGSTAALDGLSYQGQPLAGATQEVRFEWVKQEASVLGTEARTVWGAINPDANPLVQRNLDFAREAVRAKQERDSTKARLHTDGKLAPTCKAK